MRSPLALPIFGVLLCAPLLLSEHLAFQAALGAPTVLGFLLPGIMDSFGDRLNVVRLAAAVEISRINGVLTR